MQSLSLLPYFRQDYQQTARYLHFQSTGTAPPRGTSWLPRRCTTISPSKVPLSFAAKNGCHEGEWK